MLRHERMLELHDRQYQYQWGYNEGLPSSIKGETIKDLPPNEQLQAEKYQGMKLNSSLLQVQKPSRKSFPIHCQLPLGLSWDLEYTLAEFCNQTRRTRTRRGSTHSLTVPANEKATPSTPHMMRKRASLACSPYQVKQTISFSSWCLFLIKNCDIHLFIKECTISLCIPQFRIVYNETHLKSLLG